MIVVKIGKPFGLFTLRRRPGRQENKRNRFARLIKAIEVIRCAREMRFYRHASSRWHHATVTLRHVRVTFAVTRDVRTVLCNIL